MNGVQDFKAILLFRPKVITLNNITTLTNCINADKLNHFSKSGIPLDVSFTQIFNALAACGLR